MKNNFYLVVGLGVLVLAGFWFFRTDTRIPTPNPSVREEGLKIGEPSELEGVTITVTEVVEDSRCPLGVECIWAGRVVVKVNLSKPSGNFTENVELGQSLTIDTEEVQFVSVAPHPRAGEVIAPSDYRFGFEVAPISKAVEIPSVGGCFVGGCSGQICSDQKDIASTCEWRESYACYRSAKCERQQSGQCGWTETSELKMCLSAAQ